MSIEGVKIYGLCLERLKHQINIAKTRLGRQIPADTKRIALECYNTGDVDEIIDILELYDIGKETAEAVQEKLEELADTASVLTREKIDFGYNPEGHLCIYLLL